jgi:gluconate 2-dehydrogenase gamma chain
MKDVRSQALLYLNRADARTIEMLASQIIPSEKDSPGATEAGVVNYIDQALAGFMRELQPVYRRGLRALDGYVEQRFGVAVSDLDESQQWELVDSLDALAAIDSGEFVAQFYLIVREHTVQGFFGDPAYGGNRDTVGWRLVGFPGAQWGYTPEQMQPGVDARSIPILTIRDLYARISDGSS